MDEFDGIPRVEEIYSNANSCFSFLQESSLTQKIKAIISFYNNSKERNGQKKDNEGQNRLLKLMINTKFKIDKKL
jgi:hypothetical protein